MFAPIRGSGAPYGAGVESVLPEHGDQPCDRPASPYGAPPRRLPTLGPRFPNVPGAAAFATGLAGRGKERALGVCLTPGGLVQGRPGSRVRIVTAGAAPPSHSARLQSAPQVKGDACGLGFEVIGVNR